MREGGREMKEGAFEESEVLRIGMPRGSVLIFTGGLVHGGGENNTDRIRKSVLTGYQLGWLRPENKFWAYKPLHEALVAGEFSDELATLLGHADREASEGWSGSRTSGHYNGRRGDQVDEDGEQRPYLVGSQGYEGS